MKKSILAAIALLIIQTTKAQFDDRFYFPSKDYKEIKDVDYEDLYFSTDTVKLHVLWLKPKQQVKASIIYFHGAGGNNSSYLPLSKPLVDNGYQVFMLDPRGYGKSTGKPTHIDIAKDAQLIFDSLMKKNELAATKPILYGASLGTQIACNLARNNQEHIGALVLDGGMSSFTDIAAYSAPKEQQAIIKQYVTSPYSAKEDLKEIKNIPILIIHSETDKSVPMEQARLNYENANQPKELLVYEGKHLEIATKQLSQLLTALGKLIE